MPHPEAQENKLPDFQARFEVLEKKLHERLLDTEHGLKKCHQLIATARGHTFDDFVTAVDMWLMTSETLRMVDKAPSEASNPASAVDILRFQMTYPYNGPLGAFGALQLAIAYWIEASKSFRIGDYTRSLPAIIISAHYLGMACAPPSVAEHFSDTKAKAHEENTRLHRAEAVRLLNALKQSGRANSVASMLHEIGSQFEAFNKDVGHHWHSKNPQATLEDWCQREGRAPEVREAWLAAKAAYKPPDEDVPLRRTTPRRDIS